MMLLRGFFFALVIISSLAAVENFNPFGEEIEAGSAMMLDAATGKILYAKNSDRVIHPASTTKMATALFCLKLLRSRLDETVTITRDMVGAISPEKKRASNYTTPAYWIETASSHMGLKVGEQMAIRDLLRGCLIVSANDACNALALTACGSYSAFMEALNKFVKELGCTHTHFMNSHGLYHPEHVSTAHDLAIIGRALMQEPILRDIVCQRVFNRPKTNKQEPALMHNTNRLIQPGKYFCKWACGIKLGFTQQSGGSLVSCAKSEERCIILAVSDSTSCGQVFEDSKKLIEAAMKESKTDHVFYRAGSLLPYEHRIRGTSEPIQAIVKEDVKISTYPSQDVSVKGVIRWLDLVPPIRKGQYIGKIEITTAQGYALAGSPLVAAKDADPSLTFQVQHWLYLNPRKGLFVLIALSLIVGFWAWRFQRARR